MDMQALFARLGGIRGIDNDEINPMTEAEIVDFEKYVEVRLPETYRSFLSNYGAITFNGADADNPYIVFRSLGSLPPHISKTGNGLFEAFYGGERDPHDAHSLRVRAHFFANRMPNSIIPIGNDGGAGQICLGIKGNQKGKVYYWDQANEPLDEEDYLEDYGEPRPPEAMFQNVYQIAESFDDFLQRLELRHADE
jgi:hypothetical protein